MVPSRPAAYHGRRQMLRRLRIQNLVLIHDAELALAPGLNAITGETGAGKTILAQAVGLLLGAKGDSAYIGPDGEEAYVEAELDLPFGVLEDEELASLAELRPEDEEGLVLARRVFADGRTRAYAWGRGAAREDLAAVGERLIAMSGQFEQRRLGRSSYQLDVLDSFCGEDQLRRRAEARLAWRELTAARRRHEELRAGVEAEEARLAELRALVEDTEGMEAGAEESLRAERERLRHVTELAQGAADAAEALAPDEGDGAAGLTATAERAVAPLERLAPELARGGAGQARRDRGGARPDRRDETPLSRRDVRRVARARRRGKRGARCDRPRLRPRRSRRRSARCCGGERAAACGRAARRTSRGGAPFRRACRAGARGRRNGGGRVRRGVAR